MCRTAQGMEGSLSLDTLTLNARSARQIFRLQEVCLLAASCWLHMIKFCRSCTHCRSQGNMTSCLSPFHPVSQLYYSPVPGAALQGRDA